MPVLSAVMLPNTSSPPTPYYDYFPTLTCSEMMMPNVMNRPRLTFHPIAIPMKNA